MEILYLLILFIFYSIFNLFTIYYIYLIKNKLLPTPILLTFVYYFILISYIIYLVEPHYLFRLENILMEILLFLFVESILISKYLEILYKSINRIT